MGVHNVNFYFTLQQSANVLGCNFFPVAVATNIPRQLHVASIIRAFSDGADDSCG